LSTSGLRPSFSMCDRSASVPARKASEAKRRKANGVSVESSLAEA
jgi:hypothetical protein